MGRSNCQLHRQQRLPRSISESDRPNVVRRSLLRGGRYWPVTGEVVRDALMTSAEFLTRPMRESVREDEAIQMVGLVLETASECSGADYLDVVAKLVLPTADRVVGTQCPHKGTRKRQATFIHFHESTTPSISEGDRGVTDQTDSSLELGVVTVENEDGEINTDLRRREAGAIRR